MAAQIFIDGQVGTTGLQIAERLKGRAELNLIVLSETERKDAKARADALNAADLAILCLPDDAAREAVSMIRNNKTRVIDASTAHRIDATWVYGLPELAPGHNTLVAKAQRVANPGCYPTGAILLLAPLVRAGLLPTDYPVTVNAISGYSGGGKKMIEQFENPGAPDGISSPFRVYALNLDHKHLPEMQVHAGLKHRPLFVPSVGRFAQGMVVQVPLMNRLLAKGARAEALHAALAQAYEGQRYVKVAALKPPSEVGPLDGDSFAGRDDLLLHVYGDKRGEQVLLVAELDNLGKGASGAAVQNLNLMLGLAQ